MKTRHPKAGVKCWRGAVSVGEGRSLGTLSGRGRDGLGAGGRWSGQ